MQYESGIDHQTIQLDPEGISSDVLIEICQAAEVLACRCPGYLARLLRQVQAFRSYTMQCIEPFPNDRETHYWLSDRANQVEKMLVQTMLELMRKEGLIDDANQLSLSRLSERARNTALQQIDQQA